MTTTTHRSYGSDRKFLVAGSLVLAGIALIVALSAWWGARYACIGAGVGLLALAGLRASGLDYLRARSKKFDTLFLGGLGVMILILALTADNL